MDTALLLAVADRPIWQWDISRLCERQRSRAVPDDVIEGIAITLGRYCGYVPPTECEEAVELLFWALEVQGWRFFPPSSDRQSSTTQCSSSHIQNTPPVPKEVEE